MPRTRSLTGARAELARRAIDANDLVGDIVARSESSGTQLAFAVALPTGIVVYQEMNLQASQLTSSGTDSPFSELEGAVYVGTDAEPASLLFANVEGSPAHRNRRTGRCCRSAPTAGCWWPSARGSLVGSFAAAAPWIVLALGLLLSVVAFAAVDLLLRRRAYALALVEERTADAAPRR